jgi:hypothetical protein
MSSPYGKSVLGSLKHGGCPEFPPPDVPPPPPGDAEPSGKRGAASMTRTQPIIYNREALIASYFSCHMNGGRPDEMDKAAARGLRYQSDKRSVQGENYYPAYATPLAITWEAFQFHGPGTGAEVVAAVGVQRASLDALTDSLGSVDAVVSMTLVDTVRSVITRAQTPAHTRALDIGDASYVLMQTSSPAPAGDNVAMRIRVENAQGTAGAIAYGTIDIERFSDDSLTMSDIVMSPEDGEGTFRRGAVRLTFAPGRVFKPSEAPSVYYEVYGATPNASLITEITVDPIRSGIGGVIDRIAGGDHALSVQFEEATTTPLPHFGFQLKRAISLATLKPGLYQMTITVTDPKTGRHTSRTRPIEVAE